MGTPPRPSQEQWLQAAPMGTRLHRSRAPGVGVTEPALGPALPFPQGHEAPPPGSQSCPASLQSERGVGQGLTFQHPTEATARRHSDVTRTQCTYTVTRAYTHAHAPTHIHVLTQCVHAHHHTHSHVHTHMHMHPHSRVHSHMNVLTYAYMHTVTHSHVHTHMHPQFTCSFTLTCAHTCAHMHTITHIHT